MNKTEFLLWARKSPTYIAGIVTGVLLVAIGWINVNDPDFKSIVESFGPFIAPLLLYVSRYFSVKNIENVKKDAIAGTTGGAVGTPAVSSGDATTGSAPRTVGSPTTGP